MDQKELDDAYHQSVYAPNLQQITGRYATNSEATRMRLGPPRQYACGPTPVEGLDVYLTKRSDAPINVFIHGGAWRAGLAKNSAFAAELFVYAGAHFVALDFINVLDAGGRLMPMVDQVRAGSAGFIGTPTHSAGTPIAFTFPGSPRAAISQKWSSRLTGQKSSTCRPTP
jgi:arylformamidase